MKTSIRLFIAALFFTVSLNGPAPIQLFSAAQAQAQQGQQAQGGGGGEAAQIIAMLGMIAMMVMAFVMMGKKDKPKDISCLVNADGQKTLAVTGANGQLYTRPLAQTNAQGAPIIVNPQMSQLCSNPALLAQLNQNLPNFNFANGGQTTPVVLPPIGPERGLATSSLPTQQQGQAGFYDPQ